MNNTIVSISSEGIEEARRYIAVIEKIAVAIESNRPGKQDGPAQEALWLLRSALNLAVINQNPVQNLRDIRLHVVAKGN